MAAPHGLRGVLFSRVGGRFELQIHHRHADSPSALGPRTRRLKAALADLTFNTILYYFSHKKICT
jgi:hypothetical protein